MKLFKNTNQKQSFSKKQQHQAKQYGFTLLEAMVAIAIFTIVIVIGISALLNVNNTNKKSQNLRAIIDSLNYTMEDMSRNFKLGSDYHCPSQNLVPNQVNDFLAVAQDCNQNTIQGHSGSLIASLEPMEGLPAAPGYPGVGLANAGNQVVYWFDYTNTALDECTLKKSVDGGATFVTILPPEIKISCSTSGFNIFNTQVGDFAISPRIVIRISGKVVYKDIVTPFNLQTSASQRNVNIVSPQ
jgi:prepilin-type N-terminal cleavage/methylation domain-containing protein